MLRIKFKSVYSIGYILIVSVKFTNLYEIYFVQFEQGIYPKFTESLLFSSRTYSTVLQIAVQINKGFQCLCTLHNCLILLQHMINLILSTRLEWYQVDEFIEYIECRPIFLGHKGMYTMYMYAFLSIGQLKYHIHMV